MNRIFQKAASIYKYIENIYYFCKNWVVDSPLFCESNK